MLVARELGFAYARRAVLSGVSLELRTGRLLGLLGPNGAGKSTLLRCLYGSLRPDTGTVELEGEALGTLPRRRIARAIAVVPQRCELRFPVDVTHFVGLGRYAHERLLGGPRAADRAVVQACLAELGLEALAARPVDRLSGGELRRVLIAQALAQEPRLLLLDEPVQQLDLRHQLEVMEFARSFARRPGCAAAVVLHDLALAARYCDEVLVLERGAVVARGTPDEVLNVDVLRRVWGVSVSLERSPATGSLHVVPIAPAPAAEAGLSTDEGPRETR